MSAVKDTLHDQVYDVVVHMCSVLGVCIAATCMAGAMCSLNIEPKEAETRLNKVFCAGKQHEPGPDEAFARKLQQQLDMEDDYPQHDREQGAAAAPREATAPHRTPATHVAQDLAQSLFAFDRPQEDEGGRGRGRGRGRGGRRGGRGRGRR